MTDAWSPAPYFEPYLTMDQMREIERARREACAKKNDGGHRVVRESLSPRTCIDCGADLDL